MVGLHQHPSLILFLIAVLVSPLFLANPVLSPARAADEFEAAPISYSTTTPNDPVAKLWSKIQCGEQVLAPNSKGDVLESLLQALDIPTSSQCLVFSKTSLQISRIGPRTPRAIYFNETTYVGYIPGSRLIEITAMDPDLGAIFYTLEPLSAEERKKGEEEESERVHSPYMIARDRGQCLSCHATTRTERVPGLLVRSIYPDKAGRPRTGASAFVTDHRSPFQERWGGWYVTGGHGEMRHMGNAFALDRQDPEEMDFEAGANWSTLAGAFNVKPYLHDSSDIVALMVLEHQTRLHNLITRANFETRQAIHLDEAMNRALDRPMDHRSDSTKRRIASSGEELVKGLLFVDEFPLASPVGAGSPFREEFTKRGVKDSKGRSLNEFDLQGRLFKYACSYLVLSDHFTALPDPVRKHVCNRLREILSGEAPPPKGVLWNDASREETWELLKELNPSFEG